MIRMTKAARLCYGLVKNHAMVDGRQWQKRRNDFIRDRHTVCRANPGGNSAVRLLYGHGTEGLTAP